MRSHPDECDPDLHACERPSRRQSDDQGGFHALDFVAPGQWRNLVGFEKTIKVITGETDEALIQQIGERAVKLSHNDRSQGYQRATWLYQTVEIPQQHALGAAARSRTRWANDSTSHRALLAKVTPKPDKAQSIDFGVKLVVELVAFCQINGLPGDSIGDFVKSLTHYKDEALMRMAALICFDGLIPLRSRLLEEDGLSRGGAREAPELEGHDTFQRVKSLIPGGGPDGQLSFIQKSLGQVTNWMGDFTTSHNLTQGRVVDGLKGFLDGAHSNRLPIMWPPFST